MCVCIYIYRKELAHTIVEAEFRPAKLMVYAAVYHKTQVGKTGFSV